jgi:hypothetical protein
MVFADFDPPTPFYARRIAGGLQSRRQGVRRFVSHDRRPYANDPPGDQAPEDVRVVLGELLDHGFRVRLEEQGGTVDRIGECAREAKLAARDRGACVTEMRSAKCRALLEDVGNVGVEQ